MGKQVTVTIVVFLFCLLYTVAIVAQDDGQPAFSLDPTLTRTEVAKLGFGKRVNVKMTDGRKAGGRITGFAPDHFVVTDSKGVVSAIAYADVIRVSTQKEKLGVFDKPWKGIMFTAAGVGTLAVIAMSAFN
jgi:hypothetical protein